MSAPLVVAFANVGKAPAGRLVEAFDVAQVDLFALAECSDRPDVYEGLADLFDLFASHKPGGLATPIGWRPARIAADRGYASPLLHDAADMGPGTGPDHTKAKRLNLGRLVERRTGQRIRLGSAHLYTSQRWVGPVGNARARASREMLATGLDRLGGGDRRALRVLGLDGNAGPGSRTWAPARAGGWQDARKIAGPRFVTHPPKWAPDTLLVKGGNIIRVWAQDIGSDHLAVFAEVRP